MPKCKFYDQLFILLETSVSHRETASNIPPSIVAVSAEQSTPSASAAGAVARAGAGAVGGLKTPDSSTRPKISGRKRSADDTEKFIKSMKAMNNEMML